MSTQDVGRWFAVDPEEVIRRAVAYDGVQVPPRGLLRPRAEESLSHFAARDRSRDAGQAPGASRGRGRSRRGWLVPAIVVVALVMVGLLVGTQLVGGFSHLIGGTTRVESQVVAVEETGESCHRSGTGAKEHVAVTYEGTAGGELITTSGAFCTSSPPEVGGARTIWVDDNHEVASYVSPTVGWLGALGIDLIIVLLVVGLVLLRRRSRRQN